MKSVRPLLSSITVLMALAMLQTACSSIGSGGRDNGGVSLGTSQVPTDFLATENSALRQQLEETFDVTFQFMTLPVIFEYSPINNIRYEFSGLPTTDEMFELEESAISRRELLFRIAQFYKLNMKVTNSGILVSGRNS